MLFGDVSQSIFFQMAVFQIYVFSGQLWTAPELLRLQDPPSEGTQKGDVYSFAIIVHEIVVRQGLFYLGENVEMTPKGIYNRSHKLILLRQN